MKLIIVPDEVTKNPYSDEVDRNPAVFNLCGAWNMGQQSILSLPSISVGELNAMAEEYLDYVDDNKYQRLRQMFSTFFLACLKAKEAGLK